MLLLHLLDAAVRAVPLSLLRRSVAALAPALVWLAPRRVRWAKINLALAFPSVDVAARRALLRESLSHWGWNVVDLVRMRRFGPAEIRARAYLAGAAHLREALAQGRGALLIVPHLGHFELGLQRLGVEGFAPVVVQRPIPLRRLDAELRALRMRHGVELIDRAGAVRHMWAALRKGRVVIATYDHDPRDTRRAVLAPFLGYRVPTSRAIALLAQRTGAPVLPCFVHRDGPDHHCARLLPAIAAPRTGASDADIHLATAAYLAAVEDVIRRHPAHWMWSYRRFRRSPDLPGSPYAGS
jgi:KDO2-lipid IV(A) lauroyltransferase